MKKSIAASLLALGIFAPAVAFPFDGAINLNGVLRAPTCTINGNAPSFTVTLPRVSTAALSTTSAQAGKTAFAINLTDCGNAASVRAYFERGANDFTGNGMYLKNNGSAQNVVVQVMSNNGTSRDTPVASGTTEQGDYAAITNGSATLRYTAHYNRTGGGNPTPGNVTTSVTYKLEYQ